MENGTMQARRGDQMIATTSEPVPSLTTPERPMLHLMLSTRVVASWAGNFHATAHLLHQTQQQHQTQIAAASCPQTQLHATRLQHGDGISCIMTHRTWGPVLHPLPVVPAAAGHPPSAQHRPHQSLQCGVVTGYSVRTSGLMLELDPSV